MTHILESLFVALVISIDIFACSFSYGINKVVIPLFSCLFICLVSTLVLFIGLLFGLFFKSFINLELIPYLAFAVLLGIGIYKLFEKPKTNGDINNDYILKIKECIPLAIVSSFDSFSVGFSIATAYLNVWVVFFAFIVNFIAAITGQKIAFKLQKKLNYNFSWLSGAMIILLAFLQLFT